MEVETSVFAHHVKVQIEGIMKNPTICLCQQRITFMNPRSSCPEIKGAKFDEVKLVIPFAGVSVECLVKFQASQPACPPDFIFADSRFNVSRDKISELVNWNGRKPTALLETIKQLLYHYKVTLIRLLEDCYGIHQEYLSLVSTGKYSENDIEIFVPSRKQAPISFLFRLKPNLKNVFAKFFKNTDVRNYPLLLVTFHDLDKNKRRFKLYFSIELELALGPTTDFKLPSFPPNFTLGQYIQGLENELTRKAEAVVSGFELRKEYVDTFATRLEHRILEFDYRFCRKCSFIVEDENYHIIVEINIPEMFPASKPTLIFRSLYHENDGIPTSIKLNSYPYSPEWSLDLIYKETIKFIHEYAVLFPKMIV